MTHNITFKFPDGTESTFECESDSYILDAAEEAVAHAQEMSEEIPEESED